ncbi:glycoside hydrolase family 2 TIM barrel-domain containing protein [Paenibacillus hodogayensis]|uniref:Glycoside hydrolase family 2 TIM barrel-domain containing protein n=1 Tax=Paenibacillus hodogayensis TaxID=279208 RepID=A0ABV5W742_9BACL
MKKQFATCEYVYYDGHKRPGGSTDFSGPDSVLDTEQRVAFLASYAKQAQAWFDDDDLAKPVVPRQELQDAVNRLKPRPTTAIRKQTELTELAYTTAGGERPGWKLYGTGASMEEGHLVLSDEEIAPVCCAKYVLAEAAQVTDVSLEMWIDPAFQSAVSSHHYYSSIGRSFELRFDTLHAVKIKWLATGHRKAYGSSMWHPRMEDAGTYSFGEWMPVRIQLDWQQQAYTVQFGDHDTSEPIPFPCACDQLNNIFFDGGMHPGAPWRIRGLRFYRSGLKNGVPYEEVDMERPVDTIDLDWTQRGYDDSAWSRTYLPCAVGGFRERDKPLLLRKTFSVEANKRVILVIDSLDPHGDVWVNGTLVREQKHFLQARIDITAYVTSDGANTLAIQVYPRAPEVYYPWHRNTDVYHGWFAGRMRIEQTGSSVISEPVVRTRSVGGERMAEIEIEAQVAHEGANPFCGKMRVKARRWYPTEGAWEELLEQPIVVEAGEQTKLVGRFRMEADYWDVDHPVLYQFSLQLLDPVGTPVDDETVVTGIRTIDQQGGSVRLNGKPIMLNGALLMQFLPPFDDIPVNHVCPSTEQIAWQMMMIRRMNGNTARLHMLGYGTNDPRYGEICDQLGVMLIWTTRMIDTLETCVYEEGWGPKEAYRSQIRQVINHPSIVMWEGSNEFHGNLAEIDRMYDAYVELFADLDPTRLLSPCSHLYYGGGLYGDRHQYYNDDGTMDQDGSPAHASHGWTSPHVVRSCHPYVMLNGYGQTWDQLRKQDWRWQEELLKSKKHAYLLTEFAVTGDPNWQLQENEPWHHVPSYEKPYDKGSIGRPLTFAEWKESQAFQCLGAFHAVKRARLAGADGLVWCCLSEGANDVTYKKPPIDFYGHAKLGFYGLRMGFQDILACNGNTDVVLGADDQIHPVILNAKGAASIHVDVSILSEDRRVIQQVAYRDVELQGGLEQVALSPFLPELSESGYYTIRFDVTTEA